MEQITKNFKLIGGIAIIVCCALPFITVKAFGFGASASGFSLLSGDIVAILAILLILGGAAALIYVEVVKKDIVLAPKFKLSYVAKLALLVGSALVVLAIIGMEYAGLGIGLILEIIIALALFFEAKVIALINKK